MTDEAKSSTSSKQDPEKRHGTAKKEDVAAEAVNADGETAAIDEHGRPETHDAYAG